MDDYDKKCLSDIEQYGCHVVYVIEEGDLPPFAYSVGISKRTGAPEAIVIGLKRPIAHFIINEYNRRVVAGEIFHVGARYGGFIDGFECEFKKVDRSHYHEYLGYCRWLYGGSNFDAVQLVYPSTSGVWPSDREASPWFRARQPLLDQATSSSDR